MPTGSVYYVERASDKELFRTIQRFDSIVLVKGPWQVGKSSLLIRAKGWAEMRPNHVVFTDLQRFDSDCFNSPEDFYKVLAVSLSDALNLDEFLDDIWDRRRGANFNFERFLRRYVLTKLRHPLTWILDETDRLLAAPFGSEFLGLIRAIHNERALDPTGPWSKIQFILALSSETRLFITDMNQSPFNVGTRLGLGDFCEDQIADLNQRYNNPLRTDSDLREFLKFVGGQPYLVNRALEVMSNNHCDMENFRRLASRESGPFAQQFSNVALHLERNPDLRRAVRCLMTNAPALDPSGFQLLKGTSIVSGERPSDCRLYGVYECFFHANPTILGTDLPIEVTGVSTSSVGTQNCEAAKPAQSQCDDFISHNSKDKSLVHQIAKTLKSRGLNVWLDEWELVPGRPWQDALEEVIATTKSAAVLVGANGLGPWEVPEVRGCLSEFVKRKLPVIPVLLPGAPRGVELPLFLKQFQFVDLRAGITEEELDRLVWGITGKKP